MGMYTLLVALLVLLTPGLISAYRATGIVGDTLILPCLHPDIKDTSVACWGRGPCSQTGCNHPVATVNGSRVIWTKSVRYQVNRDVSKVDLPLTITDVNMDDSGKYCCRVRFPNLGIDMKSEVEVEIQNPMKGNLVRGSVDDTLTLPCKYSVLDGPREVCWGKGGCPFTGCKNKILTTDGTKVTWSESSRYQLLANISQGDSSITISGLSKDQEGTYCCRVRIPGMLNDIKNEIKLEIQDVHLVRGSVNDLLVIPCSYSTDSGTSPICWGRGHCGHFNCHNTILESDGDDVTWKKSKRYHLDGNLAKGNASLTIERANADDGGVYCCRVKVFGVFNDIKKEVRVEIRDADHVSGLVGDTMTLPCKYNVSDGTSPMCWGKGSCPVSKCTNTIISTDGDEVSFAESGKYVLRGKLQTGDVSMTIKRATKEDEGMYCCRVEVPGPFNDIMKEINLEVIDDGFQKQKN